MAKRDTENNVIPLRPLEEYEYWILPGNCPPHFSQLELHNQAFKQWQTFWTQVFKQISNERVRSEDFWRQKLICVLMKDSQIAALHLYSFFNLYSDAAMVHSYFRNNYQESQLQTLRSMGIQTVMSMEYFTVNPEFRQRTTGIPLSSLVLGLGFKVLEYSGYDAAIAPCRRDLKVDQRAMDFGARAFSEEFTHHQVPVINMVLPSHEVQPHADMQMNKTIEKVWNARRDISGMDLNQNRKKSAKAA